MREGNLESGRYNTVIRMQPLSAITAVFEGWAYRGLFVGTATVVTLFYTILLPFQYTQRLSIANWRYLDGELAFFSLVFGLLLAWLLTANVYSLRALARRSNASASLGAVLGSLLPSLLCCTPAVPTVLGIVGISSLGIYEWSGRIQSFFAREELFFLVASAGLLLASSLWTWWVMSAAACLQERGVCDG